MKLKEKWAIEDAAKRMGYTEQRVYIEGQGDLRWWLAGFDYCKTKAAIEHLYPKILQFGESETGSESDESVCKK